MHVSCKLDILTSVCLSKIIVILKPDFHIVFEGL